jgi:hypothetical protein
MGGVHGEVVQCVEAELSATDEWKRELKVDLFHGELFHEITDRWLVYFAVTGLKGRQISVIGRPPLVSTYIELKWE